MPAPYYSDYIFTSPVVDRTQLDVSSGTKKGFFNVSDFVRINHNCYTTWLFIARMNNLQFDAEDSPILYPDPTIDKIPDINDLPDVVSPGRLFELINNLRIYAHVYNTIHGGNELQN